ncbi:hypothetical protein GR160_04225 [Flavobacterium sp. Sd200]|uniref:hypothetical protein n=1 Tax=Flavobacterium sp. Sd200 TaxID=2692211 RepID=UPI001370C407|nr:hypothetical protein [Flavobacterium sp. Sd200]MXN90424.1 hypothetical protein [Flavobacterium sp. Sd200]
MDIKLANCCGNCDHHIKGQVCNVHEIVTAETQACGAYEFRAVLSRETDCLKCSKFQTPHCPHSAKASEGMMCTVFYPRIVA